MDMLILGRPAYLFIAASLVFLLAVFASLFAIRISKRHREKLSAETVASKIAGEGEPESGKNEQSVFEQVLRKLVIPALFFGAIYFALDLFDFSGRFKRGLEIVFSIFLTWFTVNLVNTGIRFSLMRYVRRSANEGQEKRIKPLLSFIRFFIWILGILFILDNLGFHISTVVAGLGIGGIAVALAAQAILGDLFSYFVIYFDRPFELGDFIIFDDILGSIEYIGVKSTKLRSLGGEQIIISNSALTNSRIRNYKRMERRRVVFSFGVLYETPVEIVREIPVLVRGAVETAGATLFDRAHFKGFGASSLDFETVYYVLSPDYTIYMDIQQSINLRIMEELQKKNVDFAYPTRTVYIKK